MVEGHGIHQPTEPPQEATNETVGQTNSLLQESEARLQRLAANLAGMLYQYVLRADGSEAFTYVSLRSRAIYELAPEELQQDFGRVWAMIHPEDGPRVHQANLRSAQQLEPWDIEFRLLPPSGCVRWVRAMSQPARQSNGDVIWDGLVLDITAEKTTQAALQESEYHYRSLAEASPVGIFWLDAMAQCTYVNARWSEMTGVSAEVGMGLGWLQTMHPDDREPTMRAWEQWVQIGETAKPFQNEGRILRPDGSIVWFYCLILPEIDSHGSLLGYIGSLTDISDRKQAEQALQQSEEKFRHFAENSRAAIWIAQATSLENLYVSSAYETTWGRSCQSLRDEPTSWLDAIHPDDRDRVQTKLEQQRQGETSNTEYRIVRPDGSVRWIWDWGFPIRNEAGQVYRYGGIAEDITDRKQLELSLQASEAKLSRILDSAIASINSFRVFSNGDWQYNYFSAGCEAVFGYTPSELMADKMLWMSQVVPEDRDRILMPLFAELFAGRTAIAEYRFHHKDGSIRWISSTYASRPVEPDCWLVTSVDYDISERVRLEVERQAADQEIRDQAALLDVASDAIYARNLVNGITFWNQGAERLYGWQRQEVLGKDPTQFLFQSQPLDVTHSLKTHAFNTVLETGTWQGELHKITKSGAEVIVISRLTLIRDDDGIPRSILTVDTDITEKKNLEAQFLRTQRLESIGTLASGIAHDLNNILTPILTSAQLLRRRLSSLDERNQALLEILERNAKRGGGLIQQVLSFARGTEGQPTTLQVGHLLLEVAKIAKQTFPKSIQLLSHIPTTELWVLRADPTQLHQVMMNLCINARDAMPKGGTLTITAKNCTLDQRRVRKYLNAQPGKYVMITIADTGTGIAPEVLERIFEPFFTTKQLGMGTGLGLSTVRTILKNHGGFVEVYSNVGKGTHFKVYLPALEQAEPSPTTPTTEFNGNGELILVVDDEVAIQETTRVALEEHGYRVVIAEDSTVAIARYTQHQHTIRIVLLDLMMPLVDGFSLIDLLQQINPQVEIIAMSGLEWNATIARERSDRVRAFLAKPFTNKELLNTLHQVLFKSE
jgi:PAS domain S-box-containing protein